MLLKWESQVLHQRRCLHAIILSSDRCSCLQMPHGGPSPGYPNVASNFIFLALQLRRLAVYARFSRKLMFWVLSLFRIFFFRRFFDTLLLKETKLCEVVEFGTEQSIQYPVRNTQSGLNSLRRVFFFSVFSISTLPFF